LKTLTSACCPNHDNEKITHTLLTLFENLDISISKQGLAFFPVTYDNVEVTLQTQCHHCFITENLFIPSLLRLLAK
jgi:hypothetical protein